MNILINITGISVDVHGGGRVQVNATATAKVNGAMLMGGFSKDIVIDPDAADLFNSVYAQIGLQAKQAIEQANNVSIPFAGLNYYFFGESISVVTASGGAAGPNPCAGPSPAPLQAFEPFANATATSFSSHQPASVWFNRVTLPSAVTFSNINVVKSMGVSAPGGTSTNSSGSIRYSYSHGLTIFSRQNNSNSSTNLATLTTGSFGLSAGVTFSSSSQTVVVAWVSDTTGGVGVFNFTSSNNSWTNFFTGTKNFQIPMQTVLRAGEYFFAHAHSSSTATTGSNVTMLSLGNAHVGAIMPGGSTSVPFGGSASAGVFGFGVAVASNVVTSTTMAGSVATLNASANNWYLNLSNA